MAGSPIALSVPSAGALQALATSWSGPWGGVPDVSVWTLNALVLVNFVGMLGCAVTGFGENIIFQLGWYAMSVAGLCSGSLTESVTILTIVTLPMMSMQAVVQRKHANVPMGLTLAVAQSASAAAGVAVLVRSDGLALKRLLGALLLAIFAWRRAALEGRLRTEAPAPASRYDVSQPRRCLALVLVGLCSGLLGGLFSTPGPPNMVFVLLARVGRDEWRSTQAVAGTVQLPVRLLALLLAGSSSTAGPGALVLKLWPHCLASLAGGLLGLLAGERLAPHVPEELFRDAVLGFLLFGGLTMLTAGLGVAVPCLAWLCAALVVAACRLRGGNGDGSPSSLAGGYKRLRG